MRLTIKGLSDLAKLDNGILDVQFKEELQKIIADMRDRPVVKAAREILIKVAIRPTPDDSGALLELSTEVEISSKTPKVRTREYRSF